MRISKLGWISDISKEFSDLKKKNFQEACDFLLGYEKDDQEITERDAIKTQKFFLKPEELSRKKSNYPRREAWWANQKLDTGKATIPIETIKIFQLLFSERSIYSEVFNCSCVQSGRRGYRRASVRGGRRRSKT